jgi:hypothetical protein
VRQQVQADPTDGWLEQRLRATDGTVSAVIPHLIVDARADHCMSGALEMGFSLAARNPIMGVGQRFNLKRFNLRSAST